jgi:hypothetical protein
VQVAVSLGPIITAALYIQALPTAAYIGTRLRTRAGGFVAVGGLIAVLAAMIGVEVARQLGHNLIVGYISTPLTAGAFLLAMAEWQVSYVERLTVRFGAGLFVIMYGLLVIFLEDIAHLGQFSQALYSLVLLVAALWTLGRRTLIQDETFALETDWFWAAFGLAIYGAATAVTAAIGNILLARHRLDLFVEAWNVRGALVILAFLSISWGVYHGPAKNNAVDLKR